MRIFLLKPEKWRQDPNMQDDVVDLLEKLGDTMDKVMLDANKCLMEELR